MSANVTKGLAIDRNGRDIQMGPPEAVGIVPRTTENGAVSSVITMTDNTTLLEVGASGTSAVLRWVASTDTQGSVISIAGATANYDVIIPADSVRKLAVPHERIGVPSIVGLGVQAGLYRRYAWKSTGVGSIMSVEY